MVPELYVSDFSVSLRFYTEILGFRVLYARHDPEFVYLEQEALQLMLLQTDKNWLGSTLEPPYGRGVNLQMEAFRHSTCLRAAFRKRYGHAARYQRRVARNGRYADRTHASSMCRTRTGIYCGFVSLWEINLSQVPELNCLYGHPRC